MESYGEQERPLIVMGLHAIGLSCHDSDVEGDIEERNSESRRSSLNVVKIN